MSKIRYLRYCDNDKECYYDENGYPYVIDEDEDESEEAETIG